MLEIDIPTLDCGNVLDLCFAIHSLLARGISSFAQHDLNTTSDHLPVLITLPLETQRFHTEPRLRFSTIDERTFQLLLLTGISHMNPLQKNGS